MNLYLYQIQYDDASKPSEASGFKVFDVRDNPEFLKREMAHMMRFYDEIVSRGNDSDLYGLFSPKFNEKSGLSAGIVVDFINQQPKADIYLFNPFPMHVYRYLNVWQQGEQNHAGLVRLAKQMFKAADIDFNPELPHRNSIKSTVYCNYWVAKKSFFDQFIPFVKSLDQAIENMPERMKDEYFSDTSYVTQACYYPFLFERLLSSYLLGVGENFISEPYLYDQKIDAIRLGRVEKAFVKKGGPKIFQETENSGISLVEISKKIEALNDFFDPKINTYLILSVAKLLRSILKSLNCIRVALFLKKEF